MPALLRITQLGGSNAHMPPSSVWRVRAALPHEGGSTRVDVGNVFAVTDEAVAALAARINQMQQTRLIELHVEGGGTVWLNRAAISRIRESDEAIHPGTEIIVAGQRQYVTESVQAVVSAVEAP